MVIAPLIIGSVGSVVAFVTLQWKPPIPERVRRQKDAACIIAMLCGVATVISFALNTR